MFEKEAKDSFNCKKVLYKWETDKHSYIDGFKDGAEFGYNKAFVEADKNLKAIVTDFNKAKELLTKWVELFKPKGGNIPPTPIQVETEQFIRKE